MRLLTTFYLLPPTLTTALNLPNLNIQSFASAFSIGPDDYFSPNNTDHELLKRQYSNTCPESFNDCANLGQPGLCCASAAVCSADAAGRVACCPIGAACSGTAGPVVTEGAVNTIGGLMNSGSTTGAGSATTTTSSFVFAQTTSQTTQFGLLPTTTGGGGGGGGFVVDGTSTVATPGAAVRGVDVPFLARAVLRVLEYLPI
ncbi:hypothetical protein LTR37_013971 [Vermiconidia calcicola]|uniref:Uncharacterized protein n=1 Tax=Vermiconidia calcicola TaxID=1690605 RepID=A0ACC3MWH4_9PEZI|nr:hypothetical protein LTR37_013971 [Vermiconidia calcicola]